jgi:hypothetical protein
MQRFDVELYSDGSGSYRKNNPNGRCVLFSEARAEIERTIAICKDEMKKVITSNVGCSDYKHNCAHFNELAFDEAIKRILE